MSLLVRTTSKLDVFKHLIKAEAKRLTIKPKAFIQDPPLDLLRTANTAYFSFAAASTFTLSIWNFYFGIPLLAGALFMFCGLSICYGMVNANATLRHIVLDNRLHTYLNIQRATQ